MQEIELLIGFVQSVGFTGLLIILAIPSLRSKIFGGSDGGDILRHLEEYYNHDLTAFMSRIDDKLEKLEKMESHLDDIRTNGVRIKK